MIAKSSKIVWSLTIIAVFAIIINNTIFRHTHILPDGKIIEHAHPFETTGKNSDSKPNHSHTSLEFLLLSYVYNLFNKSFIFSIEIPLYYKIGCRFLILVSKPFNLKLYNKRKSPRAPPQILVSQKSILLLINF